jgi:1,4-dihydroxy-2-naphthoyl-CoA hydrolase
MSQPTPIDAGAMGRRLGIVVTEASAQRVVGTMPVEGNTQPYGLLNGGASLALAETLGSIGAHLHAGAGRGAVGIEISGSHHRSARDGTVTGVATPLSLGRNVAVYEIVVSDERGQRLCTARLTCMLRDLPAAR